MKPLLRNLVHLVLAGSFTAGMAFCDSPFALGYFGIPVMQVDCRGMGMGGVATALGGENFSAMNPAVSALFNRSGISGMIIPAYSFPRDSHGSSNVRFYDFSFARLVYPLPAKFALSAGIHRAIDFDWEISRDFSYEGEMLTETLVSEGGLFKAQIAVARPIFTGFRAGLGIDFYRGEITDRREKIFSGTLYPSGSALDVRDEYAYETSALGFTVGLLYSPVKRFSAGFHIVPGFTLDLDEEFRTVISSREVTSGTVSRRSLSAEMPISWGFGLSANPKKNILLAFEYGATRWSAFSVDDEDSGTLRDESVISFGAELSSLKKGDVSWIRRTSLRGGVRFRSLPMRAGGASVDERVAAVGWGIPIGGGNGRLDIACELGSRGDLEKNGIRERLVRFGVSLSAFEKWIPIERRRRR